MKKPGTMALLMAVLLLAALMGACGGRPESSSVAVPQAPETSGDILLTDMMGREITLPGAAQKVVALSAADCEIIYALGAGASVVGRGEYCNWPEEVLAVPSVQSGNETNIEQIIALAPQVVFMSSMAQKKEQVGQLEAAGIQVIVSQAFSIAEVYQSIRIIGTALGKSAEAEALAGTMMQEFDDIAAAVQRQGPAGAKIYFEVSPLEYGLWTAGGGTFMDEIAQMLGCENIFAELSGHGGWAEISEEQVMERDPDIIITIAMHFGEGPLPEEEIMGRSGWQGIAAIQNSRVFSADGDQLSRPGPRLVEGTRALYNFIYGAWAGAGNEAQAA